MTYNNWFDGRDSRRRFIKTFAFGTAFSSVLGESWLGHWVGEALAQSAPSTGVLKLKLSDYPALANVNGSVRIVVNPLNPPPNNKPNGNFYPLIVNRLALTGTNQFIALDSKCTHMECAVGALGALLPGSMLCPCHQSTYDRLGQVTGGPAQATGNLTQLTSRLIGTTHLEVDVPGLGYRVTSSIVPSSQSPAGRYRLDFSTFPNASYEVLFQTNLASAFAAVPFALTADGPATTNVVTGNGQPSSVYANIPGQSGFLVVAIKLATA